MGLIDMLDNLQNVLDMKQKLMQDPVGFLAQRKYKIPEGMNNPNEIIQYLLNTGQISQNQVNRMMSMRNNPIIQKLFGGNQNA